MQRLKYLSAILLKELKTSIEKDDILEMSENVNIINDSEKNPLVDIDLKVQTIKDYILEMSENVNINDSEKISSVDNDINAQTILKEYDSDSSNEDAPRCNQSKPIVQIKCRTILVSCST